MRTPAAVGVAAVGVAAVGVPGAARAGERRQRRVNHSLFVIRQ